ncbi:MAG: glycosyltransferase family 2 protein [Candidatus Omnitrophica bacterium]|nr:glycosyltransferase family 2 protein [Candidatus Omnitrophota bacterium]
MKEYSISFVLPMYNEVAGIADTIEEVRIIAKALTDNYEIIISDDASTDGSYSKAMEYAKKDANIKVIKVPKNTKFGGALANGLINAQKEIIIYTDSDLPISLLDIKRSLPMIEGADIVSAASIVHKGETMKRKIISFGYNALLRMFFGMKLKDVNSGYKIFRKTAIEGMSFLSKSPFIDAEIFVKVLRNGGKIVQYPIVFRNRRAGESSIARMPIIIQTYLDMMKFRVWLTGKPVKKS